MLGTREWLLLLVMLLCVLEIMFGLIGIVTQMFS